MTAKQINERPVSPAGGGGVYQVVELIPNDASPSRVLALDTTSGADSVTIPANAVMLKIMIPGNHFYTTDGSTPTGGTDEDMFPYALSYFAVPEALLGAAWTLSLLATGEANGDGGAGRIGVYVSDV